jgi:hypothetical protein
VVKRPNLAAQALQLENAHPIAGTGPEFVLSWEGAELGMNEEDDMSTFADEISNQIDAGRQTVERSLGELREMDIKKVPPVAFVAAGLFVVTGIGLVGWMLYRNRRRRTLVERLQDALPNRVRELPSRVKKVRSIG